MRSNLSTQLAKLMKEHKVSQNALSRATGVSQPTINRILCNVTLHPRRDSLVRIANFFGVTPDSMYEPPLKKTDNNAATSLNELYEKISSLSDADRSALFSKVSKRFKEVRPDNHRRRD
ncbi:helix-turn-helix domain-containing protein [SAR92 clade bacterium H455]|uniref:Helix-turn-helix domain-containing protein n=1 Tax=SAR92 clade bacterium H455 TaxID=2974818 RepID=A0ABY5TQD4_9GAMM|nr:helix-turn-helix domain-containing protein [SAR92 clade bacterium H455]